MDSKKREHLKNRGWHFGSAQDFLGLSDEEAAYIELKLILGKSLKKHRLKKKLTHIEQGKSYANLKYFIYEQHENLPKYTLKKTEISYHTIDFSKTYYINCQDINRGRSFRGYTKIKNIAINTTNKKGIK